MYEFLAKLDRRWVFLLMFAAVALPILFNVRFPEEPSPMVREVHNAIEELPDGSLVLMAFDYDPASAGELQPMAAAFIRHCAEKHHKMLFMTLWSPGVPLLNSNVKMLQNEYPEYQVGRDFVNFGFKPGLEGVIKVIVNDLAAMFSTDVRGKSLSEMPLTQNIKNIQKVSMIVAVSAGSPGAKEWVQYAATPYDIPMVSGTTGVQTPLLYPYIPNQLAGVLGGIKAAAEYEQTLLDRYDDLKAKPQAQEGMRRMGPQLVAHMLIILLIVVGNTVYFIGRKKGDVR